MRRRLLGLNARNALIAELNPRRSIVGVRDKLLTKERLLAAGIPAPPTIATVANRRHVRRFDWHELPDELVIKPAAGSQGSGVLVCRDRPSDEIRRHARRIVDGDFSGDGDGDVAMMEPLLRSVPEMADLAPVGLPDVRVVVLRGRPLLAMLRLPTVASGGVGNLHRGGIGAAVDVDDGRIVRAVADGRSIDVHPDTGAVLVGRAVPHWDRIVAIARSVGGPTGLGYLGVDVVVDADSGPVVLEVNSHPGLEIQNVHRAGLIV